MNFEDEDVALRSDGARMETKTDDPWEATAANRHVKRSKKAGNKRTKKPIAPRETVEDEEDTPFARQASHPEPLPGAEDEFHGVRLDEDEFPPDETVLERFTDVRWPVLPAVVDTVPEDYDEHTLQQPAIAASPSARTTYSTPLQRGQASYQPSSTPDGDRQHLRSTDLRPVSNPVRRESFRSHASPPSRFLEPVAAPHKPQPHFFNLPDLNVNLGLKQEQNKGRTAGSDGYCCCFDSFAAAGDEMSARRARDALLVGSEGGLEVFRVLSNKLEVVGRLEGLRGSVIGAKIVPHVQLYDSMQSIRPLVAVILHGTMIEGQRDTVSQRPSSRRTNTNEAVTYYQTTVEVYSLQTQQHISTLYSSQPVMVEQPTIGHLSSLPEPIGDLRISASGRFITVASGKSGEVFVFTYDAHAGEDDEVFRCISKLWTSLQSSTYYAPARSAGETALTVDESDRRSQEPLLSLNSRWLAIAPPSSSSHVSIQGSLGSCSYGSTAPGLAAAVAPPPPHVTCDVVGGDEEDTWSRLTRSAAQGVVKYSQKGIDLGWQGWKEFTSPTQHHTQQLETASNRNHTELFPPTNALPDDPRRSRKEPAIVSVIDLIALLEADEAKAKYVPAPLFSFALNEGCNFLSLSTNGLRLLTTSGKGEASSVWDLTRACHVSQVSDGGESTVAGPHVRLLHRAVRNSPSIVTDCAWTRDDDCVALLTTHGTVHLHEVSTRNGTEKRRKRRSTGVNPSPEKAQATVGLSHGSSPPSSNAGFFGSIRSGLQQVTSQVSALRSQNPVSNLGIPTTLSGFRDATTSVGHAGGRVLAKGLSTGFTAAKGGASDYWHADDNKIRHKALQDPDASSSIKWVKRQSDLFIAIVCGGTVHLHPVLRAERRKGDQLISGLKHEKYGKKHFALPLIRTRDSAGAADLSMGATKARVDETCSTQGPHGFWSLRQASTASNLKRYSSGPTAPQAHEFETNPPYCPFHIDARVRIFAFEDSLDDSTDRLERQSTQFLTHGHGQSPNNDPWIFGEPLPHSTQLNTNDDLDVVQHPAYPNGDVDVDLEDQMRSILTVRTAGDEDGDEEIQINTWRAPGRLKGVDGDFDELDDQDEELSIG